MTRLTFIADTHHYSKTLGIDGRQYCLRSGSDQKCLAETGDIIDSAFELIGNSDTDAVMIAGDITNDGEMVSHIEFREKLYKLAKKKKIYLITATHDWCCDQNPRRFKGNTVTRDVEVMPHDKLRDFYFDFGPRQAISEYITHLKTCSYVIQINDEVRLLALNDDQNGKGRAGFTPEHLEWIERQIKKAKEDNCVMIGMEHHLLMPHISPLITGGSTCIGDREYVASRLADAGLRYMIAGHSHLQNTTDFKSPSGNVITEINVGSLCGYPAPILNITVQDKKVSYKVEHLQNFKFNGREVDAQKYLRNHAVCVIHRVFESGDKREFADRLTALQANGEKISAFYCAIRPFICFINEKTVGDLYKRLKFLPFSGFVDKSLADKFSDRKIMEFVDRIWINALDGAMIKYDRDSDYYRFVMSIVSIPSKIFKKNIDFKKLIFAFDAILTGGRLDNQQGTLRM